MPLLDEDFDQAFICQQKEDTIGAALEEIRTQGGQDSWHICVVRGDGLAIVQVERLKELLAKLGSGLFGLTFDQLREQIPLARQVQQQAIGIGDAERLALGSPAGVLIVMRGEEIAGRLFRETRRGPSPFPASTMGQLYGDYIDTHSDARSRWRPTGVQPPTCPHCGHQGFFRYRVQDGLFYCDKCYRIISEKD